MLRAKLMFRIHSQPAACSDRISPGPVKPHAYLIQNQDFGKEEKFEANFGFGERF